MDNRLGPLFSYQNDLGPPGRAPDQSNTKLRPRQPTIRRQWIDPPTQTNPQSQITPYPNKNQSSILNVDLMGIITNPFSVPKGIQYQQIAFEAAQVFHASRETFPTNGNVRKKSHFMNPKLRRKKERRLSDAKSQAQILLLSQTRTRMKTSSSDSHVRAPGQFQLIEIQNRTNEDIHTLEIFPRIIMEETFQSKPNKGMQEKINSLSGSMETVKRSGIHSKGVSWEIDENFGCEFTEQGYINDSFQDLWNRSSMRFDKERRLSN
ncbi:MAG: hypothetical protein EZS28_048035, partial [Streblomastix strix]